MALSLAWVRGPLAPHKLWIKRIGTIPVETLRVLLPTSSPFVLSSFETPREVRNPVGTYHREWSWNVHEDFGF